MPRNVVVDGDVVAGGGGGVVAGGGGGVVDGAGVIVVVATAGSDGLAVCSVTDGGGGVGEGRKLDCTIC
jgi:hypothetical protein